MLSVGKVGQLSCSAIFNPQFEGVADCCFLALLSAPCFAFPCAGLGCESLFLEAGKNGCESLLMGAQKNGLENSLKRSTKNGGRGAVTYRSRVSDFGVENSCLERSSDSFMHGCALRMRLSHMHTFGRCVVRGHGRRG